MLQIYRVYSSYTNIIDENNQQMSTVIDRLRQIIDNKMISDRQFCKEIGVANGFLSKVSDVGSAKLNKILNTYPEINPVWLLTGDGDMLKSTVIESTPTHALPISIEDKLLKVIAEKDKEIKQQAKEIGRLEQEVEQLKDVEKNSSDNSCEDVRGAGSAAAG